MRHGLLVEQVLAQSSSNSLQLGDIVAQLLDGLDLFLQEVAFNEIGQLRVTMLVSNGMQIEQGLIDSLFEVQCRLDSIQCRLPVVHSGTRNVLQNDPSASLVLILHQLLGMATLFVRLGTEELVEAGQCDIIAIEVEGHGHVDVTGVQFHVDLLVQGSLSLLVKVLSNLTLFGHD